MVKSVGSNKSQNSCRGDCRLCSSSEKRRSPFYILAKCANIHRYNVRRTAQKEPHLVGHIDSVIAHLVVCSCERSSPHPLGLYHSVVPVETIEEPSSLRDLKERCCVASWIESSDSLDS